MVLDNAIYPRILLPLELKMWRIWDLIIRFATTLADSGDVSFMSPQREFEETISRENATISKICFSYSSSVAEFDDLRQDALINIWRGMRNFRGKSSEKTWIYRVTVNSCLSTIRKQSRHRHDGLENLYDLLDNDDTDKDAIEQMHRAIGTLSSQEKAIIMMWLDELSYDDIAAAMGFNRNTVATKIRRIKDKITKQYKKEENL